MNIRPFITIRELKGLLEQKKISPSELLNFYLRRFEVYDTEIQSALEIFDKASILEASSAHGSVLTTMSSRNTLTLLSDGCSASAATSWTRAA